MANRILVLAALLVAAAPALSLQPYAILPSPEYAIDDLGVLPGDSASYAWGINEAGMVVGGSDGPAGMRAFLFTDGSGIAPLACPTGRPYCLAREVNLAGQAAGSAWTSGIDWPGHAMRWSGGRPEDLGALGAGTQSEALGINETGTTVGYSYAGGGAGPHGFLFADPSGMEDATPADAQGYVYDINDAGWRTGYRLESDGYRAVRWEDGVTETFGVLPGLAHSFGTAINDRGQIAGYSKNARGDVERIIRFTDGVGLQNLGGAYDRNRAWGINAHGDVVGEGRPTSGPVRAVLYRDGRGLQELNQLIDTKLGWYLFAATDINDEGQIVGYGSNLYRPGTHAVRLTPNRVDDAPHGLRLEGIWPDTIRLSWAPVTVAGFYRVYESEDRFAPFPWRVLAQTPSTSFDAAGHLGDGRDHFYIVRAVRGTDEGGNSTMASKLHVSYPYTEGTTHLAWISLPYNSVYQRASDVAAAFGPKRIDVVGKWDASTQSSIVYYHTGGGYKGADFSIAPGDGIFLGLRQPFDWVWTGTDSDARVEFRVNSAPVGNVAWFGLPYAGAYRHASDIANELGPGRIAEIGRWNADLQSAERWVWAGTEWTGSDFPISPGDGLYVVVVSDFSWQPALLTSVMQ